MINIIFIIFALQLLLGVAIVAVLWVLFDRELWISAMEKATALHWDKAATGSSDIMIVTACLPDDKRVASLKQIIVSACPWARVELISSVNIIGGVILRCGHAVEDFSVMGRLDHLRGRGQ